MNPTVSPLCQTIGNTCVGLAALIYALPLQNLILEFARKRNDSAGGMIATLIILIPLWLLLSGGLVCVAVSGEFNWLRPNGTALYALIFGATLAMAFASFLFVGMSPQTGILQRIVVCAPVYLFPLATMGLVFFSLNSRFATNISPLAFRLPWTIFAALSVTACVGVVGYQLIRSGARNLTGVTHRFSLSNRQAQENLAKIPTLDPQADFVDLLRLSGQYQSREVREAAAARLRTHPDFEKALITELTTGKADAALEFIYSTSLASTELNRFAQPTRVALQRFTNDIPAANYMSADRRKELLTWGREMFRTIVAKFATTGVDFAPTMAAFERALAPVARAAD